MVSFLLLLFEIQTYNQPSTDSTVVVTLTAAIPTSSSSFYNISFLDATYLISTAATQPLAGLFTDSFGRGAGLLFLEPYSASASYFMGYPIKNGSLYSAALLLAPAVAPP